MPEKNVLLRPTQILGALCHYIFRCKLLELLQLSLCSRSVCGKRSRAHRKLAELLGMSELFWIQNLNPRLYMCLMNGEQG